MLLTESATTANAIMPSDAKKNFASVRKRTAYHQGLGAIVASIKVRSCMIINLISPHFIVLVRIQTQPSWTRLHA